MTSWGRGLWWQRAPREPPTAAPTNVGETCSPGGWLVTEPHAGRGHTQGRDAHHVQLLEPDKRPALSDLAVSLRKAVGRGGRKRGWGAERRDSLGWHPCWNLAGRRGPRWGRPWQGKAEAGVMRGWSMQGGSAEKREGVQDPRATLPACREGPCQQHMKGTSKAFFSR